MASNRINRLGGRSKQKKWILQVELFNEIHRWAVTDWKMIEKCGKSTREVERHYEIVRDFFKAAEKVWGDAWGSSGFMVTRPVTLKAMLRVCADLARTDADLVDGRARRWERRLAPWSDQIRTFRAEGFYERFPARGQIEGVGRIYRELARLAGLEKKRPVRQKRVIGPD